MSKTPNQSASQSWRDELLTTLVPHAVHRLGNLLTVVMGTADLLALNEADPDRAGELNVICGSARRATELVRALGLHARSQPGEAQALDLRDIVVSLGELSSPVAKGAGYELAQREAAGVTVVRTDPARLQLLLLGLVVAAAAPGEGLVRRDGVLSLRAVELATRVVVLLSLRVHDGVPAPMIELAPRAQALAAELGISLRTRTHPGGQGQSLLLGLPAL